MATTSPNNSLSPTGATPTPYRLDTRAVEVWTPAAIDPAVLAAIRSRIEPNQGWWQFPLPTIPWQVRLGLGVYSTVVGLGVIAIAIAAYLGGHR